jgi:transposase
MDTSTVVVERDKGGRRKVRRRTYTLEQKLRVVADANESGASLAEVARRQGINANLVFNWRRQHQLGVLEQHTRQVKLLSVRVSESAAIRQEPRQLERVNDEGRIEITLAGDIGLSIIGSVAPERVEQVITLLRRAS